MEYVRHCYQIELNGVLVLDLPSLQTAEKPLTTLAFFNFEKEKLETAIFLNFVSNFFRPFSFYNFCIFRNAEISNKLS